MAFATRGKEPRHIYGRSFLIVETEWRMCVTAYLQQAKIILLAVILDVTYQTMVLEEFYPGEALIVGVTLGLVPYVLIRGLAARFARLLK
jgi:hypothetical protein